MRAVTSCLAVVLAACGNPPIIEPLPDSGMPPVVVPDAGSEPPDAGEPLPDAGVPSFTADTLPAGPAVWLKVDLTTPAKPRLEVWAKELALVRGVAFHLGFDPAQLKVDSAAAESVMGTGERTLSRVRGGDVALGLVRLASSPAETDLGADTKLATLELSALGPVDSRPSLNRLVVRRADGTHVPVKAVSGRLVVP